MAFNPDDFDVDQPEEEKKIAPIKTIETKNVTSGFNPDDFDAPEETQPAPRAKPMPQAKAPTTKRAASVGGSWSTNPYEADVNLNAEIAKLPKTKFDKIESQTKKWRVQMSFVEKALDFSDTFVNEYKKIITRPATTKPGKYLQENSPFFEAPVALAATAVDSAQKMVSGPTRLLRDIYKAMGPFIGAMGAQNPTAMSTLLPEKDPKDKSKIIQETEKLIGGVANDWAGLVDDLQKEAMDKSFETGGAASAVPLMVAQAATETATKLKILGMVGLQYAGNAFKGLEQTKKVQALGRLANAAVMAAPMTASEYNGDFRDLATSYLWSTAYMATPALSGFAKGKVAPAADILSNLILDGVSEVAGNSVIEQSKQRAMNEGHPERAVNYAIGAGVFKVGSSIIMGTTTKAFDTYFAAKGNNLTKTDIEIKDAYEEVNRIYSKVIEPMSKMQDQPDVLETPINSDYAEAFGKANPHLAYAYERQANILEAKMNELLKMDSKEEPSLEAQQEASDMSGGVIMLRETAKAAFKANKTTVPVQKLVEKVNSSDVIPVMRQAKGYQPTAKGKPGEIARLETAMKGVLGELQAKPERIESGLHVALIRAGRSLLKNQKSVEGDKVKAADIREAQRTIEIIDGQLAMDGAERTIDAVNHDRMRRGRDPIVTPDSGIVSPQRFVPKKEDIEFLMSRMPSKVSDNAKFKAANSLRQNLPEDPIAREDFVQLYSQIAVKINGWDKAKQGLGGSVSDSIFIDMLQKGSTIESIRPLMDKFVEMKGDQRWHDLPLLMQSNRRTGEYNSNLEMDSTLVEAGLPSRRWFGKGKIRKGPDGRELASRQEQIEQEVTPKLNEAMAEMMGTSKDSPRYQEAKKWIEENYSNVKANRHLKVVEGLDKMTQGSMWYDLNYNQVGGFQIWLRSENNLSAVSKAMQKAKSSKVEDVVKQLKKMEGTESVIVGLKKFVPYWSKGSGKEGFMDLDTMRILGETWETQGDGALMSKLVGMRKEGDVFGGRADYFLTEVESPNFMPLLEKSVKFGIGKLQPVEKPDPTILKRKDGPVKFQTQTSVIENIRHHATQLRANAGMMRPAHEMMQMIKEYEAEGYFNKTIANGLRMWVQNSIGVLRVNPNALTKMALKYNAMFWHTYPLQWANATYYNGRNLMYQGMPWGPLAGYFDIGDLVHSYGELLGHKFVDAAGRIKSKFDKLGKPVGGDPDKVVPTKGDEVGWSNEHSNLNRFMGTWFQQEIASYSGLFHQHALGLDFNAVDPVNTKFFNKIQRQHAQEALKLVVKAKKNVGNFSQQAGSRILGWSDTAMNRSVASGTAYLTASRHIDAMLQGDKTLAQLKKKLHFQNMSLAEQVELSGRLAEGMKAGTREAFEPFIQRFAQMITLKVNGDYSTMGRSVAEQDVNNRVLMSLVTYPRLIVNQWHRDIAEPMYRAVETYAMGGDLKPQLKQIQGSVNMMTKMYIGMGIANTVMSYFPGWKENIPEPYSILNMINWTPGAMGVQMAWKLGKATAKGVFKGVGKGLEVIGMPFEAIATGLASLLGLTLNLSESVGKKDDKKADEDFEVLFDTWTTYTGPILGNLAKVAEAGGHIRASNRIKAWNNKYLLTKYKLKDEWEYKQLTETEKILNFFFDTDMITNRDSLTQRVWESFTPKVEKNLDPKRELRRKNSYIRTKDKEERLQKKM